MEENKPKAPEPETQQAEADEPTEVERRTILSTASLVAMGGGLVGGYGLFGVMAGRYLYPTSGGNLAWQFVAVADELKLGEGLEYIAPTGEKVVVARQGEGNSEDDFVALSSVCPHLGCQVHWEPHNDRFFCPCHNGVFNPQGAPLEGPPKSANQHLLRFPLRVTEEGLLFIHAPTSSLVEDG